MSRRSSVTLVAILLALSACSAASQEPTSSQPAVSASADASTTESVPAELVVKFAGINALTGQSAAPGTRTQHGAELAAKLINDNGGFDDTCGNHYTVEISASDMANDGAQAVALLRGAADDTSILGVIGPTPSTGLLPSVPVAGELGMPIIGLGTAPIVDWNRFVYRGSTPRAIADRVMLEKLHDEFNFDKMAIIYDQSQDSEAAGAQVVQDAANELGFQVVAAEAFRAGDQDFSTQIDKIKASGADWLGLLAAPAELGKVAKQVRERGVTANLFASAGNFLDANVWDVSGGAIEGGYTWTTFDFNAENADVSSFFDAWASEFPDEDPTLQSIWGNDAMLLAIDAVKRACTDSDRSALADALGSTDNFQGLGGSFTYQNPPNGENQTPTVLIAKATGRGTYEIVQ